MVGSSVAKNALASFASVTLFIYAQNVSLKINSYCIIISLFLGHIFDIIALDIYNYIFDILSKR